MGIHLPKDGVNWSHSYHLFVITVDPAKRQEILSRGAADGIPYGVHYSLACHQHAYIAKRPGAPQYHLPRTEHLAASVVSLPLNPYLQEEDMILISAHLRSILGDT